MRSSQELRRFDDEVYAAFRQAANLVSSQGMPMAEAAEKVCPQARREQILKAFGSQPLHLQGNTVAVALELEGASSLARGDFEATLETCERIAATRFAVRGGGGAFERATDLWRCAGAALACDRRERVMSALTEVWDGTFAGLSSELHGAFRDLSIKYTMPWCGHNEAAASRHCSSLVQAIRTVMKTAQTAMPNSRSSTQPESNAQRKAMKKATKKATKKTKRRARKKK